MARIISIESENPAVKAMECSRVVRWTLSLVVSAGTVGMAGQVARAQQEERQSEETNEAKEGDSGEASNPRQFSIDQYNATLQRPDGWVRRAAQKGALVSLRAAGDRKAHIEIRASSPIKPNRQKSFFNSFHSRLKDAGFVEREVRQSATYGGHVGEWRSYEGRSDQQAFRLVVWQLYRQQVAWLFVGFFPAEADGTHVEDFETLLESLTFE